MDVADLGDEDRRDRAPDPIECLDRLIARVVAEALVDLAFEHDDLTVVDLDQIAQ